VATQVDFRIPIASGSWVPHIPDFLWNLVGSVHIMRLSLKERRTRSRVQCCVQEIRGISLAFREMWDTTSFDGSPARTKQTPELQE
jgi:hypothetical protein